MTDNNKQIDNPSLEQLANRMSQAVPRLKRAIRTHEHRFLAEGIITESQLWALMYLSGRKSVTMSEYAHKLDISGPSTTCLVDCLIKQNLVERTRSQEDRRVVSVQITKTGKKFCEEVFEQQKAGFKKVFRPLNAEERGTYLRIIEKLLKALNEKGSNE